MMRVDVDFNERDRRGHVVARVPGDQASNLAPGRRVYLYDPLERLWAEASVARVNPETRIAAFDVDWHSFADAEVADLSDGQSHWYVRIPIADGLQLPASAFVANANVTRLFLGKCALTWTEQAMEVTERDPWVESSSGTGVQALADLP
jgi:hypothetical protein